MDCISICQRTWIVWGRMNIFVFKESKRKRKVDSSLHSKRKEDGLNFHFSNHMDYVRQNE